MPLESWEGGQANPYTGGGMKFLVSFPRCRGKLSPPMGPRKGKDGKDGTPGRPTRGVWADQGLRWKSKMSGFVQGGPLLVISRVITPLNGLITE